MDVREKLVELLKTNACPSPFICDPTCRYYGFGDCFPDRFADYLIAHGVTVQEWISVKDRLPEENGRYLTANKRWDDKISVFDLWFDSGFWYIDGKDDVFDFEVTHWMPMPNPPKGE